ncbi:hypothetical protein G5A97_00625 [[Clostridium] symbiosum]|nr:hypothetical protein [[Clostridium] symbiosum]
MCEHFVNRKKRRCFLEPGTVEF